LATCRSAAGPSTATAAIAAAQLPSSRSGSSESLLPALVPCRKCAADLADTPDHGRNEPAQRAAGGAAAERMSTAGTVGGRPAPRWESSGADGGRLLGGRGSAGGPEHCAVEGRRRRGKKAGPGFLPVGWLMQAELLLVGTDSRIGARRRVRCGLGLRSPSDSAARSGRRGASVLEDGRRRESRPVGLRALGMAQLARRSQRWLSSRAVAAAMRSRRIVYIWVMALVLRPILRQSMGETSTMRRTIQTKQSLSPEGIFARAN
jgi:hypothetical protein